MLLLCINDAQFPSQWELICMVVNKERERQKMFWSCLNWTTNHTWCRFKSIKSQFIVIKEKYLRVRTSSPHSTHQHGAKWARKKGSKRDQNQNKYWRLQGCESRVGLFCLYDFRDFRFKLQVLVRVRRDDVNNVHNSSWMKTTTPTGERETSLRAERIPDEPVQSVPCL